MRTKRFIDKNIYLLEKIGNENDHNTNQDYDNESIDSDH